MTTASGDPPPPPDPSGRLRNFWRMVWQTVLTAFRYRAMALAAEAAFFAILSLPPLIFAGAGAIGFVSARVNPHLVDEARDETLRVASQVLTPTAVATVIQPTMNDVLAGGRADVISIGFLIALWSGSRALNVFIDAIGIMYGFGGHRHFIRARILSFVLYVIFILVGGVVVPLVLAGPRFVDRVLPGRVAWLGTLYWPVVLLGSGFFLATLYKVSLPRGFGVRSALPGAALALVIWVCGSLVLRLALSRTTNGPSIYGPLAAPIAVLLWLYLVSVAVLVGAAFNSGIDRIKHPETYQKAESSKE